MSDTTQYTRVLINSGNAWYIMGKVDSAIAYFRPALDLCLAHNDTMQALSAGLMLASMLTAKGELDQAMDMLNDNVLLARTAGRPDMLAVSTFQRGVLLKQARRGAEALAAFEETWKLCDSIG
ncbi:MAG TPA: tetratricopeptide repeat protein, partial [Polyangium sp.]|nr:tetratricopeptide repeat protein [Polyangium sp.]